MIIGNKCDMEDKRVVSTDRGQDIAKANGIPFVETSARTNVNITRAFHDMTMRILERVSDIKYSRIYSRPIVFGNKSDLVDFNYFLNATLLERNPVFT